MIHAAQVVPQNVEKLPLFRWRPGARVLAVGDRDGPAFDGVGPPRGFVRDLDDAVVAEAARKARVDALCAWWSDALAAGDDMRALAALARSASLPLVVGTAGHGEQALADALLAQASAWVLFIADPIQPLAAAILARAPHVEVVLGLDEREPPRFPAARAAAVHLVPRRANASPETLARWIEVARLALGDARAIYTSETPHDDCACGARLVWRAGGRSRVDELDAASGACRRCGRASAIALR